MKCFFYTLDTTLEESKGNNSAYNSDGYVDVSNIKWYCEGNMQMKPWRIGGKNITKTDRKVWTATSMSKEVTKVALTVGSASSITVNSLKLTVASDADFSNVIEEQNLNFVASSTINAVPAQGAWEEGAFYKFTFNVTVSGNSNKFVEFSKVEFYYDDGGVEKSDPAFSYGDVEEYTINLGETFQAPALTYADNFSGTIS